MYVLQFNTKAEAEKRSFDEAALRLGADHTTELWWGWIEKNGKFYLLVDEDTENAIQIQD